MSLRGPDRVLRLGLPARATRVPQPATAPMNIIQLPLALLLGSTIGLAVPQEGQAPLDPSEAPPAKIQLKWTHAQVEHLLNRAAFGASSQEIDRWQEAGPEALFSHLFSGTGPKEAFKVEMYRYDRSARKQDTEEKRRAQTATLRRQHRAQVDSYCNWWVDQMAFGDDPLRERMVLVLHGLLVSSSQKVRQSDYLIGQNELFREYALGNYGRLLLEILHDPAMLLYLDNNTNRKAKPNENLARELLELFSLGEGNYTEADIKEAARALTGNTVSAKGYQRAPSQHDNGNKTVLGVTDRMTSQELVEVILEQDACADYIATRLITEFEGMAPTPERLANYAQLLRRERYEFEPFLRTLFTDPEFYREEVVGTKVLSPVDFMVGTARRMEMKAPTEFLYRASTMLGQELLNPPSVKGWDGGFAWLTESSMMLRSNAWGAILGEINQKDLNAEIEEAIDMMDDMMGEDAADAGQETGVEPRRRGGPLLRLLNTIRRQEATVDVPIVAWLSEQHLHRDKEIASALLENLLAIPVPPETQQFIASYIAEGRKELNLRPGKLLSKPGKAKKLLMRTIHLILSLPEANLG